VVLLRLLTLLLVEACDSVLVACLGFADEDSGVKAITPVLRSPSLNMSGTWVAEFDSEGACVVV
jgi:hypothetical protein